MASIIPVNFTVEYDDPEGEVLIKNYNEKFYVADGGYFKKPLSIINSNGYVNVDISNIVAPIYRIIIRNRDVYSPPPMTTLRLTINDGSNPPYYDHAYIENYFDYGLHRSYSTFITKIEVKTNSITQTSIDVIIINKMAPPAPV